MKLVLVCALLLLPQDDVAARLKKEGWRAVADLLEKGEDARAALEKAAADRDPDVTFYARAALGELDCRRGGEFAPVPRTRAASGAAGDVLAGLFKAAGVDSILDDVPKKTLTLPDDLTFAEAIAEASRALNVEFVQAENGAWKVIGPPVQAPRFAAGRVRAVVSEVSRGTALRPGLSPRCYYWVQGRMDSFGRFRAAPLVVNVRVIEAEDEHGRDLRRTMDADEGEGDGRDAKDKERRAGFNVPLEAPDLTSTKVARLRLAVDFAFKKKDGVITFEKVDGAMNVKKKVGDVEATLLRASREDEEFHVELRLKAPNIWARFPKNEDDFRGGEPVVQLLDAAGKAWDEGGGGSGSGGGGYELRREYRNRNSAGPPATFTVALLTEVESWSVYLEFRDVPLR
jgi:hypothetical protein